MFLRSARTREITDHGHDVRLNAIYPQVRGACTYGIGLSSVITKGYLPTMGLRACPFLRFCPARRPWSVIGVGEPEVCNARRAPKLGQMRRGFWARRYVGGAAEYLRGSRSMDGARFGPSVILFRRVAPARNPRHPRIPCDGQRDAKHPSRQC